MTADERIGCSASTSGRPRPSACSSTTRAASSRRSGRRPSPARTAWSAPPSRSSQTSRRDDGRHPTSSGSASPGWSTSSGGAVKHAVNLGVDGDWRAAARPARGRLGSRSRRERRQRRDPRRGRARAATDDLVYLSIGTGLAAGLVLDGAAAPRCDGAAGEIGHVPVDPPARSASAASAAASRPWPPAAPWPQPGRPATSRPRRRCSPPRPPVTRGRSRSATASPRASPTPCGRSA